MDKVRIYQPRKTAMQSGRAKTRQWLVEFEPISAVRNDNLMGWVGMGDTRNQVRMRFASREEARTTKRKSYSDNFAHNRNKNWTH
jgi:hypothetical protein